MKKGFTLIELLIVIAILGTLAVVVLLALNPVQQLGRTRDAGRISGVTQVGHAAEAYRTSNNGNVAPIAGCSGQANWLDCLVASGEISSKPAQITNSLTAACTTNVQNGWCYAVTGNNFVVFSRLESTANISRCPTPATDFAFAVYSSADSRGGIICRAGTQPTAPAAGTTLGTCGGTTCVNAFLP